MVNSLRPSLPVLLVLSIPALGTLGWNPRFSNFYGGLCASGGDANAGRQRVLLSAKNVEDGDTLDAEPDQARDHGRDSGAKQQGKRTREYLISRLEDVFEMGSDFHAESPGGSPHPHRLVEVGEWVLLGDWMGREEGQCYGEFCGEDFDDQCDIPEEFKMAGSKVDVMSFLGIRRAEPLQVLRDWD